MIGCDINNMNDETKKILMNKEVIAINQDKDCNAPFTIKSMDTGDSANPDYEVIAKLLSNGDIAIGVFNFSDQKPTAWDLHFTLDSLGLPESTGKTLLMKELWTGEETKVENGFFSHDIEPHGCLLYRAKVVDK